MYKTYAHNGQWIPERMLGGIERYVEHGIRPGRFLVAVICNDLEAAVNAADSENLSRLPVFVSFFSNEADADCWGSPEKMEAWMTLKREEREKEENDG